MKTFRVTLDRTVVQTVVVAVTAKSEDDAEAKLDRLMERDVLEWSVGEVEQQPMVVDVEEV